MKHDATYGAALARLYGLEPRGIRLGLARTREALAHLGHPDRRYACALVAGTNGKGSTSAYLAAALQAHGLRVGLYASPHVERFEERIRVDGRELSPEAVPALVDEALALGDLTFFEAATVMALSHYARARVDVAVLEVGMGGRLDATNAVSPRVSVVTPIGRDHLQALGPTLADVTREKLGVARRGRPLVLAPQRPAVWRALQARLADHGGRVWRVGRDARCVALSPDGGWRYEGPTVRPAEVWLAMPGRHQGENLAAALLAAGAMAEALGVAGRASPGELARALEAVRLPARLARMTNAAGRRVVVDGAHNEDAARCLAAWLREAEPAGYDLVFGCLADKRPAAMLRALATQARRVVLTRPESPRAAEPHAVARAARRWLADRPVEMVPAPAAAVDAILADGGAPGARPVVIAGSFYLAGAALPHLRDLGFVDDAVRQSRAEGARTAA